jgi:sorting nexin-14
MSICSSNPCSVCGEHPCFVHSEENAALLQPAKGLQLHPQLDDELAQLLNTVLDQFVQSWYKDLDVYSLPDRKFDLEMRLLLKHVLAVCIKRLRTINLKKTITSKLLPALIQHSHVYLNGKRLARAQQFIERSVLKEYNNLGLLQQQMRSEMEETKWLRNLSELLLPLLMPPKALNSNLARTFVREIISCGVLKPVIAIVADPFYVNDILAIMFDADAPPVDLEALQKANDGEPKLIPLLAQFEEMSKTSASNQFSNHIEFNYKNCLGIELSALIKDQQMLFLLLRFLKEEGSVNYLQFILTIDGFNEKILNPELNDDDRHELHADANQICRSYFLPNAHDYIDCLNDSWAIELQAVLDQGPQQVDQLRKIDTLFEAYERVYSTLENKYLPRFFESDLYIKLIVGSRAHLDSLSSERLMMFADTLPATGDEMPIDSIETDERLSESDLDDESSEKAMRNDEEFIFDYGIDLIELIDNSDIPTDEQQRHDSKSKDLSTWRVKIEKVETKLEHNSFKYFYVYVVRITQTELFDDACSVNEGTIDDEFVAKDKPLSWLVERKYDEFYVLDEKLKKFHGNALDSIAVLSPKRTLFKQSVAFLEGRRREFEKYVQALLTSSRFQRSELLYNFLKPSASKKQQDIFNSRMMGINIKKMIKTVPAKFSQEKGQHLDAFLTNFVNSTEAQKVRGNVPDLKDIFNYVDECKESFDSESATSSMFNSLPFEIEPPTDQSCFSSQWVYDYFTFFLTRICLSRSFSTICAFLLRLLQPILKPTVNCLFDLLLDRKLNEFLTVDNITYSLQQLRLSLLAIDPLQPATTPPYSSSEAQAKCKQSLANMQKYFQQMFQYVPGLAAPQSTVFFVHSVFQHQLLNKQLFYLLFSLLIEDLFPEIVERKL